ncbi:hypothetical protein [Variovorax sp. E3]|uniref:hypothetical protein n=1 Tax=Variovorax sp. E3 TaxID=1914993 RepID=UPI0018DB7D9F|nr:hypothetical protein [Variovorax sp. E3]
MNRPKQPRILVPRLIALAALLGFTLSLLVHIAALLGTDVSAKFPYVWTLHVGIFVVFFPFIFFSRKDLGPKPTFAQIREFFPSWVVALGCVIAAYTAINFLLFIVGMQGGSPAISEGKFILQDHGRLVREVTAAEYTSFKANEVRGFSGHWLLFYFVPFAYFMFGKQSNLSAD